MPRKNESTTTTEQGEGKRQNLRLQARHSAVNLLIEENFDRFQDLLAQEHQARGVEYVRELTPDQKAAADLEKLIAENPRLEAQLRKRFATGEETVKPEGVTDEPAAGDSVTA